MEILLQSSQAFIVKHNKCKLYISALDSSEDMLMSFEDGASIAIWKLFDQNNIALTVMGNEDIIACSHCWM
jgi:hypothetical protein